MFKKIKEAVETVKFVRAMTNDEYLRYIDKLIADGEREKKKHSTSLKK